MPKATHNDAIARQWEILKLLPTRGSGVSTSTLTAQLRDQGFVATKRTVERDIIELSRLFPIERNDRGTPYGYRWMDGASLDVPGVSIAEAVSLRLIEDHLQPLLPAQMMETLAMRFSQARRKLEAMSEVNPRSRWNDKVRYESPTLPFIAPRLDKEVVETVHAGLMEERQLRVYYQGSDRAGPKEIVLHPLALVHRGVVGYLVATAFDYPTPRQYAMHRILDAELLNTPVVRPPDFDLAIYLDEGGLQFNASGMVALRLALAPHLARALGEAPLSADQRMQWQDDKSAVLEATVQDSWPLQWWLMSKGSDVQVLAPPHLRDRIAEALRQAADQYSQSDAERKPPAY